MISPDAYFIANKLYDKKRLQQHCEQNLVYIRESKRFPNVVMLHYAEEVAYQYKLPTVKPYPFEYLDEIIKDVKQLSKKKLYKLIGEREKVSSETKI